jgi:hypothetical protein
MFKWLESRVLWGSFLILAGLLFLLQNVFNLPLGGLFWAALLALGGLLFISVYLNNRQHWWALIPGFTLLGVAATVFVNNFFLYWMISQEVSLSDGIGLAFAAVYLSDRRNWWAIIPAGVMLTLAAISVLDQLLLASIWRPVVPGPGVDLCPGGALTQPHGQMSGRGTRLWCWL